jgi:prepilin-type N-terminal cleavage/methylation domain-containing protein
MRKSAFTFIEILVAITVFAIGVLAVLRLITQNLVTLDATEMRTTATFLAKEWIELVYNMRDSNLQKSLPRDCVLDPNLAADDFWTFDPNKACMWSFASGTADDKILQVAFVPDSYTYIALSQRANNFADLRSGNRLYYTTGDVAGTELHRYGYQPVEGDQASVFSRYISFDVVREWGKILPPNKLVKVESHVLYMKGTKTGEVVLESIIWNY